MIPDTRLIAALAAIALLIGAYIYGRHDGARITEAAWQTREARINAEAADKIAAADKRVRDQERAHAEALAGVAQTYEDKLKGKNDALNTALNSLRAGGRLYVNATCPPAGRDGLPGTPATPGQRDATTRAELSLADSEFLLRLGSEADRVAEQLAACQAVIRADRAK